MFKKLFKNAFYCAACSIIVSVIFCFICLKGSNKTEAVQNTHNSTIAEKSSSNKAVVKDVSLAKENKNSKSKYIDKMS